VAQTPRTKQVEKLLTTADMCNRWGVSRKTWRLWELAGDTPRVTRRGRRRYYDPADVERWEERRKTEAAAS